jgi:hypothetical protein
MKIRVKEIIDLNARIREINSVDLEDIEFLNDKDEVLYIKQENIDQWKFIGLNNTDFIGSTFINMDFQRTNISPLIFLKKNIG